MRVPRVSEAIGVKMPPRTLVDIDRAIGRLAPRVANAASAIFDAFSPASSYIWSGMPVVDKHIRQNHGADFQAPFEQSAPRQEMQHVAAEAADRAFFHRDQHLVVAGESAEQIVIKRLHEARIGDAR